MEPSQSHPSEETLSAYRDGELTPNRRTAVEAHVLGCPRCRVVLRDYDRLATSLRYDDLPVPAELRRDLQARLTPRPSSRFGFVPALGSLAAALFVVVVGAALFAQPTRVPVAAAYPAPNATAVDRATAVEIVYQQGIDKQAVEAAVAFDPPIRVRKEWRGDTLVLKPQEPLAPDTTYSVRAPAAAAPSILPPLPQMNLPLAQAPTPEVVTRFTTGPVAMAAASSVPSPHATAASPAVASLATQAAATPATSTPMTASATASAVGTGTATKARTPTTAVASAPQLADLASFLARKEPAVAKLGATNGPARAAKVREQRFAGGRMLWREDERLIYVLRADGQWLSYPDIYPDDEDQAPGTPTPAPAPTATRVSLPTPAAGAATPAVAEPTETVTATPAASGGPEPKRKFGKLWRESEGVRKALGRAAEEEREFTAAVQAFDGGAVLATERRNIYLLEADGRWLEFAFLGGEPRPNEPTPRVQTPTATATATPTPSGTATPGAVPPSATPTATSTSTPVASGGWVEVDAKPAGCDLSPERGFGLVYQDPVVQARLGCATGAERVADVAEQRFERGWMLWRADTRDVIVLADDGRWTAHADTYVGGEAQAAETPPAALLVPTRGFGKVWREAAGVRGALGYAIAAERGLGGAVQAFAAGEMLWSAASEVFVLYADGRWERFPDRFKAPGI